MATRIHILEISCQVRFTKEDGNSSAIPAGTLEGGIPLLSTHPELRATLGALFSVKACILIITLIGGLSIYGLLNKVSIYHMECNKKLASHVENVITYVRWM